MEIYELAEDGKTWQPVLFRSDVIKRRTHRDSWDTIDMDRIGLTKRRTRSGWENK